LAIYYHISTNLNHDRSFTPRIPQFRHQDQEDDSRPRVSVAPSIENCLTAIPNGGIHLDELSSQLRGYFLVFRIDTEKLGISEDDIVTSQTLFEKDWVRDADVTDEYWIMKSFEVPEEDCFLIKLIAWDESSADILPHSIYAVAEEDYDGDYLRAYEQVYQDMVPCSIVIENVKFVPQDVKAETEVILYFEDKMEQRAICNLIKNHDVTFLDQSMDQLQFKVNKDCSLRDLYLEHSAYVALSF
jgi:hypothetical protein